MSDLTKEELWRQLKQKIVAPVYVLCGAETYLRDRAAAEIVRHAFLETDLREFNQDEFSLNDKAGIQAALAAAEQLPMMSARRVVTITDVRVAAASQRDTLREDCEEHLAAYFAKPSATTVLVFIADELNGNRKITRLLKKHGVLVEFKKLDDAELFKWINRAVEEHGASIEDRAVRRLIELVGADLRRLNNEIEKLHTASLPDSFVNLDLVNALSTNSRELDNWVMTDAIISGRGSNALASMKKILDDGAEPVALLGLISYNFRRLLMAKEMMLRGEDRRGVAAILRLRYRDQEDFLSAARRADREKLIRVFSRLKAADLAIKTSVGGGGTPGSRMQLEVLVCEIVEAMDRVKSVPDRPLD